MSSGKFMYADSFSGLPTLRFGATVCLDGAVNHGAL